MRAIGFLLALVACKAPSTPLRMDAGPPVDAEPLDASSVDAPPGGPTVVTNECERTPVTAYDFGDVAIGQLATAWFAVARHGDETPIITLTGGPEFSFEGGTPTGLPARVKIALSPTTIGPKQATLRIFTLSTTPVEISITANAVAARTDGLVAGAPAVHGGTFIGGVVEISNPTASTAIDLMSATVTSADAPASLTVDLGACPATLEPGDTCLVTFRTAYLVPPGCHHYTAHLQTSVNTLDIATDGRSSMSIMAFAKGGTIDSVPGGLNCTNGGCTAGFDDGPIVLSAVGAGFEGWSADTPGSCDQSSTCAVPYGASATAAARFATASANFVTLGVTGAASGGVLMVDQYATTLPILPMLCGAGCTYAATGPTVLLATGTSRFMGWGGACSGTAPQCNLGTPTAAVTASAIYATDDREIATIEAPARGPENTVAIALLPGGDAVTATSDTLARVTASGAVVWRHDTFVRELATSASGDIYDLEILTDTPAVVKLDANGNVVWRRDLLHPHLAPDCTASKQLAITASGDVAVIAYQRLWILAALDGTPSFTDDVPGCRGVAADATGTIAVAVDPGTIRRYANGARVLPDRAAPFTTDPMTLAFGPDGSLVVLADQDTTSTLTWLDPSGSQTASVTRPFKTTPLLAITPSGAIVTADTDGDLTVRSYDASGAVSWTLAKPGYAGSTLFTRVVPSSIAIDSSGRVAVAGLHVMWSAQRGWAEIFQFP